MDLAACLQFLRPGAGFSTEGDQIIAWHSPEPMPTLAECDAAWPLVQQAEANEAHNASIRAQLAALDAAKGVRAITDALNGDRTRLDALEAEKAALRAQFV